MSAYLLTHSLMYSWLYAMKDNPYEDLTTETSAMEEFRLALQRKPTPTNEAMQNGIDFENLVTSIVNGKGDTEHKWYEPAKKIADIVAGGQSQFRAKKIVTVKGIDFVLYGRLDWLKAGTIFDIKFSKAYDRGKYFGSTQHPTYMEIIPEARRFTYLVSNGTEVWTETYYREECHDIRDTISDFIDWLKAVGLMDEYKEHWIA